MTFLVGKCPYCCYFTDVKCNLKRHLNSKHSDKCDKINPICEKINPKCEKINPKCEKINPECEKVNLSCDKINSNDFKCSKCNKIYKSNRYLKNHELKCNRLDKLTCPRCMLSFSCSQSKYKHIKANKCIARSIIHARVPNAQNITNNNTTNNTNNCNNTTNNTTNNIINDNKSNCNNNTNIYINNYGNERLDYLTKERIFKILLSGHNTIPLYIQDKHFNDEFPENNNIKYSKDCKCLLKEENEWKEKDLNHLSKKLIKDNSKVLLLYYNDNKIELQNEISNEEIIDNIKDKLFIIYNETDNQKYNNLLIQIKELIKSSNL
jgi:hypothetical protein